MNSKKAFLALESGIEIMRDSSLAFLYGGMKTAGWHLRRILCHIVFNLKDHYICPGQVAQLVGESSCASEWLHVRSLVRAHTWVAGCKFDPQWGREYG